MSTPLRSVARRLLGTRIGRSSVGVAALERPDPRQADVGTFVHFVRTIAP